MSFRLDDVTFEYGTGRLRTLAVAGITFAARGAEFLSIVGPSGSGKTTLLKIVAGLLTPTTGSVSFDPPARAGALRSALVFQNHGLLPWYDVLENVALGLRFQGGSRETAVEKARRFVVQVGLEKFLHRKPHELSIGMQQRVALARAFVADPEILLMDEPFGSLDAQTRLVLQEELLRIWHDHRKLVVHVTHDIDESILLSDRILVTTGRPARIRQEIAVPFARPRHHEILASREAVAIRETIWSILEDEVRESLCVPA